MPDLILRITGSRFLSIGKDPYMSLWLPGDAVTLYNPNLSLHSTANGVTSTPFFLWLQKNFAQLPYCTITKIWWLFQEVCFFISFLLCWQLATKRLQQILIIVVTTAFFMFSYNWWLNIYNGQMYVIYLLAFSVTTFFAVKYKKFDVPILLYPFIILIRPFFVFSLLPFIQFKKRALLKIFVAGSLATIVLVVSTSFIEWQQYFAAMKVYAGEAINSNDWHVERTNEYYFHQTLPIEACTINTGKINIPYSGGCLYSVQHYLAKMGIKCSNSLIFSSALLLVVGILYYFFIQQKIFNNTIKSVSFAVLLYFLAELFTPASRNPYGMIQWMPVLVLILLSKYHKLTAIIIIGLLLNHNLITLKYTKELGELLLLIVLACFVFIDKKNNMIPIENKIIVH